VELVSREKRFLERSERRAMTQESADGDSWAVVRILASLVKINHTLIARGAYRTPVSRVGQTSFEIPRPFNAQSLGTATSTIV